MASVAAALLDELMGRDRNLAPTEKRREIKYDDPEVCKFFLCSFCPHELFVNTRADIGPCEKTIHDEELRKGYQESSRFERLGYEEEFVRFLQSMVSDVEKRIKRGQARLSLNNSQGAQMSGAPQAAREEKVQMLTEKINELVEQAEQLGCEGKVEEAQGVMKLCEQLREERQQLDAIEQKIEQASKSSKDMEICNVCGAFLVVGDAQQRMDEHLMGKQHMGYARIRSYIDGRRQKVINEEQEREDRLKKEREEREKERERERERRRQVEKEREERERRRRSRSRSRRRSRSRSRHRRRSRSRSRDRRRRSRSRSRHRRRRSRSRDRKSRRSRSRGRRSRSRSSSRRTSRGKDRERDRSRDRDHGREKSRDKDRDRDRDRDRERSRDKDRKRSRSRSKSRSREKSRDKERSRERSKERDMNGDQPETEEPPSTKDQSENVEMQGDSN